MPVSIRKTDLLQKTIGLVSLASVPGKVLEPLFLNEPFSFSVTQSRWSSSQEKFMRSKYDQKILRGDESGEPKRGNMKYLDLIAFNNVLHNKSLS